MVPVSIDFVHMHNFCSDSAYERMYGWSGLGTLGFLLPSTVCTLYRVSYTDAQAYCGAYVCVMQHR